MISAVERALVFTDLVDSTRLAEHLGDERARELWSAHDRAARALLALHGGLEIDRSDGFFLVFDSVAPAAEFALAYHSAISALGGIGLAARVALHFGPVTMLRNAVGDVARGAKPIEVEGLAKPYGARLMSLAGGGQTLLSASAQQAMAQAGTIPQGAELDRHGHYRFKGIETPAEVFELGRRGQAPFMPPPDNEKAYRVVADDGLWRPVREVAHNLGGERDVFVGRGAELRTLAAQLDTGARLVTVVGAGGIGKTRFVRRYAASWLGEWPGGVYFCDLTEARSVDGILFVVSAVLGVPLATRDAVAQIGHAIAARGRCLLILDNFEQIVEHAAATLEPWLARSSHAAFVVTSRERLHVAGEALHELEPLALSGEAIELFEARARAHRPGFKVGPAERAAVAEAVRLLDGLPLAIELAAARLRVMSPAQLVERLRDRFTLLAGSRGAAGRQATLRAAIDWSWQLLTPCEQAALAQCSVFEGGFTLGAAEAVLDLSPWADSPPVIDTVQALLDKSLLRSWVHPSGQRVEIAEPYFGMYLSIHEFAAGHLHGDGAEKALAAEARHGRHFAAFGSDKAIDSLNAHGSVRRRVTLSLELDNLIGACRRALERRDGAVAAGAFRAVWSVLSLQGSFALGAELGVQVLALDNLDTGSRIGVAKMLGPALRRVGRNADARACLEEALALSRALSDRTDEGNVLLGLSALDNFEGRPTECRARIEAAIEIFRAVGARRPEGSALSNLGMAMHDLGRLDEARVHYEAALVLLRAVGDRYAEGIALGNLAALHNDVGRFDQARAMYQATIEVCREIGDREGEAVTLADLGKLELDLGRLEDARAVNEQGLRISRELGSRRNEGVLVGQLGSVLQRLGHPSDARVHYDQELAIAREFRNRRVEGQSLCHLGDLALEQGDALGARALLAEGENLLREIDDRMDLGELLCVRARVDLQLGDPTSARAALGEAETIAATMGVELSSRLGQGIARLRVALGST